MNKKRTPLKKKIDFKKFAKFLLFLFLISYVSYTFVHQQMSLSKRETVASKYEEKISDAELEQEQLKKELEKVKSDEYLEKMAREKLGLVKANERIFVDVTRD